MSEEGTYLNDVPSKEMEKLSLQDPKLSK